MLTGSPKAQRNHALPLADGQSRAAGALNWSRPLHIQGVGKMAGLVPATALYALGDRLDKFAAERGRPNSLRH